jgi:hypothetical protein
MRKYSGHEKELIGEFFLDLEILTADEIEKILQWQESRLCCKTISSEAAVSGLSRRELRIFSKEHRN